MSSQEWASHVPFVSRECEVRLTAVALGLHGSLDRIPGIRKAPNSRLERQQAFLSSAGLREPRRERQRARALAVSATPRMSGTVVPGLELAEGAIPKAYYYSCFGVVQTGSRTCPRCPCGRVCSTLTGYEVGTRSRLNCPGQYGS